MPTDFDVAVDYYEVLGLTAPVTGAMVQAAYAKAIERMQRTGATLDQRERLEQARRVLSEVLLRASYDKARERFLKAGVRPPSPEAARPVAPAAAPAPVPERKPVTSPPSVTMYEAASAAGIEDAERRVGDFPDDLDALSWLAFQYYSAGDYAKAIEAYQRYVTARDDDPEAHYYLARAFERLGRKAEAHAAARRVIEIEPNGDRAAKCKNILSK